MTNILGSRSQELLAEFIQFRNKVYQNKPELSKNSLFQFTIKLNKKGNWICQCLSEPKEVQLVFCKTSTTLLKRLSYLRGNKKLEFAQDIENSKEFHIALSNVISKKRNFSKVRQLQFLF